MTSLATMSFWVFRRCKYYIIINSFISCVGIISHKLVYASATPIGSISSIYLAVLFRLFAMIRWFEWVATFKYPIHGPKRAKIGKNEEQAIIRRIFYIIAPMECASFVFAQQFVEMDSYSEDYLQWFCQTTLQMLTFIPKSLIFEVIFDFFHYIAHRTAHSVPCLYQTMHKRHHWHLHPSALSTFEQDAMDLLFSTSVPFMLAIVLSLRFTMTQLHLLLAYKTFIEVAGHSGLEIKGFSFPQCPIVNVLSICLHANDHDLHHTNPKWNFCKRFCLWDKAFGTFRHGKERTAHHIKKSR